MPYPDLTFYLMYVYIIGASHNDHPSSSGYVIALAIVIPLCVLIIIILVMRYCVTHKRQRGVTLTMRRARRARRMEAFHIDIEYSGSNSEVKESRGYTNLAAETSPDEGKEISSMINEQTTDGQTDKQSPKDNDYENSLSDHVDDDEQANDIPSNMTDHVDNGNVESRVTDHVNQYDTSSEIHFDLTDHVDDHVKQYDVTKPQPPIRFDFSDTESTTSAENWALVSASEMNLLTRNDVTMIGNGDEDGLSSKSTDMENTTITIGNMDDENYNESKLI